VTCVSHEKKRIGHDEEDEDDKSNRLDNEFVRRRAKRALTGNHRRNEEQDQ
jgi:hypothetical protein